MCCGLLLAFVTHPATAQIRTVLVSPIPGDPVGSGTALRNALVGIPSPSSTNRWLLKIEPGIYDVGAISLEMRSWVDIEGSGIGVTTIRGSASFAGTINGASDAELRLLTVEAIGGATQPTVNAMYNGSAHPRLYRVKLAAYGGALGRGALNEGSAPDFEECEISVSATGIGSQTLGIESRGYVASGQRTSILRSKIAVGGAETNVGIWMRHSQKVTELRDSRIDATGGVNTYGILAQGPSWAGTESLALRDVEILSGGGSSKSYGVRLVSDSVVYLDVTASKIWGHSAPTTYGIEQAGNAPVVVQSSNVLGFTQTVRSDLNSVAIASTHLTGGPVTAGGWLGCMGVWDENAVFYANSCP